MAGLAPLDSPLVEITQDVAFILVKDSVFSRPCSIVERSTFLMMPNLVNVRPSSLEQLLTVSIVVHSISLAETSGRCFVIVMSNPLDTLISKSSN